MALVHLCGQIGLKSKPTLRRLAIAIIAYLTSQSHHTSHWLPNLAISGVHNYLFMIS